MAIDYQFRDVDAHGAPIRAWAASFEVERQSASAMCLPQRTSGAVPGQTAWKEFIAQPGRNFAATYEQPNARGQMVQTVDSNMAKGDNAVGSRRA
jgi:hypothetical protein